MDYNKLDEMAKMLIEHSKKQVFADMDKWHTTSLGEIFISPGEYKRFKKRHLLSEK